jgi:hypothetical protein
MQSHLVHTSISPLHYGIDVSPTIRCIAGKGIHSQGHVAKIKPAVEQMMVK